MWFPPKATVDWGVAVKHLRKVDPIFAPIIDKVGPCTLRPRRDHFCALCQAILTQQISTAVAKVMWERLKSNFPRKRPTPELLLKLTDEQLRAVGLSRQKMSYMRDLSA